MSMTPAPGALRNMTPISRGPILLDIFYIMLYN